MYKSIISTICLFVLTIGCDSTGSTKKEDVVGYKGFLVDSAIQNVSWSCGDAKGTTNEDGAFGICPNNSTVTFSIGNLIIGEAIEPAEDYIVTVQDMLELNRDETNNSKAIALTQLLLSMHSDGNPDNGINVTDEAIEALNETVTEENVVFETLKTVETDTITVAAVKNNDNVNHVPTPEEATQHLEGTNIDIEDGVQEAGEEIKENSTS